jgi:hypothetical protein
MGDNCNGLCIPADLTEQVPKLQWEPRDDICTGCTALATPWATTDLQKRGAVGSRLDAMGDGPELVALSLGDPLDIRAVYDEQGNVQAAFRTNFEYNQEEPCGRLLVLRFAFDQVGAYFLRHVGEAHGFLAQPADQVASLMDSTDTTVAFSEDIVGQNGINDFWFSNDLVAVDLSGTLLVGDLATGTVDRASLLDGAPAGQYPTVALLDGTAFVGRWDYFQMDVWLLRDRTFSPFIVDPDRDIQEFVTDGQVMIWKEGRDPVDNPPGSVPPRTFQHYSLMIAPYTEDSAELAPKTLLAEVEPTLGYLQIANGKVAGMYLRSGQTPRQSSALVADVQSGRAWRAELADTWSVGFGVYPTSAELWSAVTRDPLVRFETYARVPYSATQVIQESFP